MQRIKLKGRAPTLREQQLQNTRHAAAMSNLALRQQIESTIELLDERKEQGARPEAIWQLDYESEGTTCIADWVGI